MTRGQLLLANNVGQHYCPIKVGRVSRNVGQLFKCSLDITIICGTTIRDMTIRDTTIPDTTIRDSCFPNTK